MTLTKAIAPCAIIGSAGRNQPHLFTAHLWQAMVSDVQGRISPNESVLSGGAAWADHLAVHAYLQGWAKELILYLPAPFESGRFVEPSRQRSAASVSNYYHKLFSNVIGVDTLAQLNEAIEHGAYVSHEPCAPGYGALFARNKKIALAAKRVIAYTFGSGSEPSSKGTLDTWRQIQSADKTHVDLGALVEKNKAAHKTTPLRFRLNR